MTDLKKQITLLKKENAELRRRLEDEHYASELRDALSMASVFGNVATPVSHARLLEMIVETAAQVLSAEAAALFLLDEAANELTFEVALGGGGNALKKVRVPLGKGIAGFVAESQQPLIIADVANSGMWIGKLPGDYVPRSILCVPMFHGERLCGVLELCDKVGADSFNLNDMEALGFFANLAATTLELSSTHGQVASLIGEALDATGGLTEDKKKRLRVGAQKFAANSPKNQHQQERLELARLVQSIAWQGESEFVACRALLQGFAEYLASRPASYHSWATYAQTPSKTGGQ